MRLAVGVAAVVLALALLAAVAARGPRKADAWPQGRLVLEGLALLAIFVLAVVVTLALRS
jgi:hypothetical protein